MFRTKYMQEQSSEKIEEVQSAHPLSTPQSSRFFLTRYISGSVEDLFMFNNAKNKYIFFGRGMGSNTNMVFGQ